MSTFAGKDLRSHPDQICGGRTKSASVICPPGQNLLALSVPPDQIRGRTDFTVTPDPRTRKVATEFDWLLPWEELLCYIIIVTPCKVNLLEGTLIWTQNQ